MTKAHLSQQNFVLVLAVFVTPIWVDVTDGSEHWATDGTYVKVNCDTASFMIDVDWIVRDFVIRLPRSKNLDIPCVK